MDIKLPIKNRSSSIVLIVIIGTLACLLFTSMSVFIVYVFVASENDRLAAAEVSFADIPTLDKDGLKYFINRVDLKKVMEKSGQNAEFLNTPLPSASP